MNPLTSGSPAWQVVFISFAAVLILFEAARGWRLGLPRQIVRVFAIAAAYAAAYFGGSAFVPMARPFVQLPDFVLSAACGAILALIVYSVITSLGVIIFKRTAQHNSAFLRALYGFTGASIGIFVGTFFVWLLLLGVRTIGGIADAQLHAQSSGSAQLPRARTAAQNNPAMDDSMLASIARLKNSIELGPIGNAVKSADVLPTGTLQSIANLGEVLATPATAARFLSYPPAHELTLHPRITALRNDREILAMLEQGRVVDLMRDGRVIAAINDPTLLDALKKFDLQRAIEYAHAPGAPDARR